MQILCGIGIDITEENVGNIHIITIKVIVYI